MAVNKFNSISGILFLVISGLPGVILAQSPLSPPEPAEENTSSITEKQIQEINAQLQQLKQKQIKDEAEISQLRRQLSQVEIERARDMAVNNKLAAENAYVQKEIEQLKSVPQIKASKKWLSLSGFIHADAATWRQSSEDEVNSSTGDPLNETRFLIRRARLRLEGDYGLLNGRLEFDGNTLKGFTARLIGAEVSLQWPTSNLIPGMPPYIMATLGSFKTPFGFEVQQSDRERLFLERSNVIRALFPGEYDLGGRLQGGWRFLRYAVAIMNGCPIGEQQFPGRDPNESKDFMGRLGVETTIGRYISLAAGFSALYGTGFHKGTPLTKDTLVWRDTNENNIVDNGEIQSIPGQVATPSENFKRHALGGDLHLSLPVPRLGPLFLQGEIIIANNLDRALHLADPIAAGRDLREIGFSFGFTQTIFSHGMIGVRYDRYNPDRDANDLLYGNQVPKDASYSTLAVAGALRYSPYGRLILEYDHHTNALGRSESGLPTTLADDALILRGEVTF